MKLNGEDFGALFGVSKASVSQWESARPKNRTQPELDKLLEMCRISGAPKEWLLSDASDCEFEFWLDEAQNDEILPKPLTPEKVMPKLTAEAVRLGRLFDLIPEDQLIKRAVAYNAATAAIVAVLEGHTIPSTAAPALDQKRQPV